MKSHQCPQSFAKRPMIFMVGCFSFSVYLGLLLSFHEQQRIMWEYQLILRLYEQYLSYREK